jgi:L-ascorbate metabolism protein UlaG (beta-lactamase superfamily)
MAKLIFLGHSCWQITTDKTVILIDPFINGNPQSPVKESDVSADYLIVTHAHGDHLGDSIPIAKRSNGTIIANYEIAVHCGKQGAKVHPMHIGGSHVFPFGKVKLTPAWHGSSFPDGSYGGTPAGCLITVEGKTIYHSGDTGLFMDMQLIGEMNPIDVALIPIGDNFTMGIDDAVKAVSLLKPKKVIPMHYNTFDMILSDPALFREKVKSMNVDIHILKPGESISL